MNKDLIDQLEEEARKLQSSTIPTPKPEETEEETEDIDYEEVEENLIEVYDDRGNIIKIEESELEDYRYCEDDTYVENDAATFIFDGFYNPFTEKVERDEYDYAYIEKYPHTWRKLLTFSEAGEYSFDKFVKVSIIVIEDGEAEIRYLITENGRDVYVRDSDLAKHNYDIKDKQLIKRRSVEDFKKQLFEAYPYFEQTIDGIYRDHWDINYHHILNNFCLIIKFDEFTIINSKRQSHIIKDLYVLIPFNVKEDKVLIGNSLWGGRGTVSNVEFIGQYNHSHLNGSWDNISTFCLGSGPIHKYILEFNLKPNEHNLFSVLYNVKIYVEWESLEGTPHRYIERLGKGEITTETKSLNFIPVFNKYIKEFKLPLKIFTSNNITQLKIDENILEVELLKIIPDQKVYKNRTTGKYYRDKIINFLEKTSSNILLNFKGENIYTRVYNVDKINIQETDYVVHPSITKQFMENALKRIRGYYFKKTTGIDTGKSHYFNI